MPREISPSSYECDCGHQLHFCEGTIRQMKELSYRGKEGIGEGDDRHAVIFHKGVMVAIFCPKRNAEIPATDGVAGSERPSPKRPGYTARQGQVLAFIHLCQKLNQRPPAEADIARFFRISAPSAHQMVVMLHHKGMIERQPGVGGSIRLKVDAGDLPELP